MADSHMQRFLDFKGRLAKLVLEGKISKEKEIAIIDHVKPSSDPEGLELENHINLSDEDLISF